MKNLKYLLIAVSILFCACSSSPEEIDGIDPTIQAEREALTASTQYGIYKNGKSIFLFDKTLHQLSTNPSKQTYRILDNSGTKYVELRLDAAPKSDEGVNARQLNNMNLQLSILGTMILLKSDNEKLWLWSDSAHTGFIVPKGGI